MNTLRIPEGKTQIIDEYNDISKYDTIIMPSSVKVIANSFNNCKNIKNIIFETGYNRYFEEYEGIIRIENSFNSSSIEQLELPFTARLIIDSFSNCKDLKKLSINTSEDRYRRLLGINTINKSFCFTSIERFISPPTVHTIESSFKGCTRLKELQFLTAENSGGLTEGIRNLSIDSFEGANISDVDLPLTIKGNKKYFYQKELKSSDFFEEKYIAGMSNNKGNDNARIFDKSVSGFVVLIFENEELSLSKCTHPGDHQIIMRELLAEKNFHDPQFNNSFINEFTAGVIAARNNTICFLIDGETVCAFLPNKLDDKQKIELTSFLKEMIKRENENSDYNFNVNIYFKDTVYAFTTSKRPLGTKDFIQFLIQNQICEKDDFSSFEFISAQRSI